MNYQETLTYLYGQLPIFQRTGKSAYKADLSNTIEMDQQLGRPHEKFKTIHVAGTNGKGSVSHMVASVLQSAGYKTGLYTSPHLVDFRERIRVDGKKVAEAYVVSFVEQNRDLINRVHPSFFEMTVAMAFKYFASEQVDVAVIEVGLGGRLDSTNIIHPDLSIITNIGMDHMALLGQTLELIAKEKAGVIKESTPVVVGRRQPEVAPLFLTMASEKNAPILFADEVFRARKKEEGMEALFLVVEASRIGEPALAYNLPLGGFYQQENLKTVLAAVDVLRREGYRIDEQQLRHGIENVVVQTGLAGRWQKLSNHPLIVCDVAHNEDGMRWITAQLKSLSYERLHIVFGMVSDKDVNAVLALMPREAHYYFTKASIPRAMSSNVLKDKAFAYGLKGQSYGDVSSAFEAAKKNAGRDDVIFVGGSTFVVAEILEK